jgi:dystonin
VFEQGVNEEVRGARSKARDLLTATKRLRRESSIAYDDGVVGEKVEELQQLADSVGRLSADRLNGLEQALPLANHFNETHQDLNIWLSDFDVELDKQDIGQMNVDQMKDEQQRLRVSTNVRLNSDVVVSSGKHGIEMLH